MSISKSGQATRHTLPSWRATNAAWDVRPPQPVRIPRRATYLRYRRSPASPPLKDALPCRGRARQLRSPRPCSPLARPPASRIPARGAGQNHCIKVDSSQPHQCLGRISPSSTISIQSTTPPNPYAWPRASAGGTARFVQPRPDGWQNEAPAILSRTRQ